MDYETEKGRMNVAKPVERVEEKHERIIGSIQSLDNSIDALEELVQKAVGAESNVKELPECGTAPISPLAAVLAETSATILERRDRIDEIVTRLENILF